jgi:hypothetical protein
MRRLTGLVLSILTTCTIASHSDAADPRAIKIGVLTDMSSVYADVSGVGSVAAATLAAEDAGRRQSPGRRSLEKRRPGRYIRADVLLLLR